MRTVSKSQVLTRSGHGDIEERDKGVLSLNVELWRGFGRRQVVCAHVLQSAGSEGTGYVRRFGQQLLRNKPYQPY